MPKAAGRLREEKIVGTTCFVYVVIFEGKIKRKKRERVSFGNMKLAKKKKKITGEAKSKYTHNSIHELLLLA